MRAERASLTDPRLACDTGTVKEPAYQRRAVRGGTRTAPASGVRIRQGSKAVAPCGRACSGRGDRQGRGRAGLLSRPPQVSEDPPNDPRIVDGERENALAMFLVDGHAIGGALSLILRLGLGEAAQPPIPAVTFWEVSVCAYRPNVNARIGRT